MSLGSRVELAVIIINEHVTDTGNLQRPCVGRDCHTDTTTRNSEWCHPQSTLSQDVKGETRMAPP